MKFKYEKNMAIIADGKMDILGQTRNIQSEKWKYTNWDEELWGHKPKLKLRALLSKKSE